MEINKNLITAEEAAKYLAISKKTIYNYVSEGFIPHIKIRSNLRFRKEDLDSWLDKLTIDGRKMRRASLDEILR